MTEFTIYLAAALCIVFPLLRAGLVKQGFSAVTQTATMFVALIVWVGLIWNVSPPPNIYAALVAVVIIFEVALWLSTKAVTRRKSSSF
jgi:hypothetical protein